MGSEQSTDAAPIDDDIGTSRAVASASAHANTLASDAPPVAPPAFPTRRRSYHAHRRAVPPPPPPLTVPELASVMAATSVPSVPATDWMETEPQHSAPFVPAQARSTSASSLAPRPHPSLPATATHADSTAAHLHSLIEQAKREVEHAAQHCHDPTVLQRQLHQLTDAAHRHQQEREALARQHHEEQQAELKRLYQLKLEQEALQHLASNLKKEEEEENAAAAAAAAAVEAAKKPKLAGDDLSYADDALFPSALHSPDVPFATAAGDDAFLPQPVSPTLSLLMRELSCPPVESLATGDNFLLDTISAEQLTSLPNSQPADFVPSFDSQQHLDEVSSVTSNPTPMLDAPRALATPLHSPHDAFVDNSLISAAAAEVDPIEDLAQRTSQMVLSNYENTNLLGRLDAAYRAGHFSRTAVRQLLMWSISSLHGDNQNGLLGLLFRMTVAGRLQCMESLQTCSHHDIHPRAGVPCCPLRIDPSWGGPKLQRSFEEICANPNVCSDSAMVQWSKLRVAELEAIKNGTALPLPTLSNLSPLEPAPDDIDGGQTSSAQCRRVTSAIARSRLTMLFAFDTPPSSTSASVVSNAASGTKRKLSDDLGQSLEHPSSPGLPVTGSASATSEHRATPGHHRVGTGAVESVASTNVLDHRPLRHAGRMIQINRAFERLTGYTQRDMIEEMNTPPSEATQPIRIDHLRAFHRIMFSWRIDRVQDGVLYLVYKRKDQTDLYCLSHWRMQYDRGLMVQTIQSIMPLPNDPVHPPPPYVEGVDLDENTLLFGYRPPSALVAR